MKLYEFNTETISNTEMREHVGGCNNKEINKLLIKLFDSIYGSKEETELLTKIDILLNDCK